MTSAAERLWARVRKTEGCWEWAGGTREGYGRIWHNGVLIDTHRLSWLLHNGPIPPDLCVLHHCDNRRCVRPDHLFLGTRAENIADMDAKGRRAHPKKPVPLRCKHGHPFDAANTYLWRGQHHCRACRRARMADRRRRAA